MVSSCCAFNCSEKYTKGGRVTFHSVIGGIAAEEMNSNTKGRKRKELKTDEDEVIEYIEELEARKRLPKCVVCSRLLVNKKKEYLGTLTSTTGLSLHQCLIGISGDKSTKIKDCAPSDVVCVYCAHLINYADKLEAELAKLKAAINGCLEIKSLSEEDQEMLKPQFDSHTAILDEFSKRVVGPGSAADRGDVSEKNPETDVSDIVIKEVISVSLNSEPIQVKESIVNSLWKNNIKRKVERVRAHKPDSGGPLETDPPVLICQICQLRTSSRAVLLYHLRRHMANYQWCDFCDKPLIDEDDESVKQKKVRDPT